MEEEEVVVEEGGKGSGLEVRSFVEGFSWRLFETFTFLLGRNYTFKKDGWTAPVQLNDKKKTSSAM